MGGQDCDGSTLPQAPIGSLPIRSDGLPCPSPTDDDRQISSEDRRSVKLRVRPPPAGTHQCHRATSAGSGMMLTVKFSGRVADVVDDTRHAELPRIPLSPRDHQPRRLAGSPLRRERSRCRGSPGPTGHHGVLRSDPAVVSHVRFRIRSPAHASTGPAGRHLARGRGLRHHPGTAALSLACRRSRWRRPRYPCPVASRLPGCQTRFPQAAKEPGV